MGDIPVSAANTELTPTITSVTPAVDVNLLGGTTLTITGTAFPHSINLRDDLTIVLENDAGASDTANCVPISSSNKEIKCLLERFNQLMESFYNDPQSF